MFLLQAYVSKKYYNLRCGTFEVVLIEVKTQFGNESLMALAYVSNRLRIKFAMEQKQSVPTKSTILKEVIAILLYVFGYKKTQLSLTLFSGRVSVTVSQSQ